MVVSLKTCFVGMVLLLPGCASRASPTPPSPVWIADWKEAFPMNIQRNGAASVIVKDKIYIIDGVNSDGALDTTEYTTIQQDGSLDPWQLGPRLNVKRAFMEAVVHGDYIYVAGGGNGPGNQNYLRSVERAQILADGSLGPWQMEKNEMVVARRCNKLIATDKALYAFGGRGGTLLDIVESAEWQPDGSLGEWRLDPEALTMPRYINSVQKVGDVFFVIGGHRDDGNSIAEVEWSRPMADGNLQKWQATTPMQQARWGHDSVAYGDELYALGGLFGPKYLDSIERTKVGKDGQLGPWQFTTSLDQPRGTFSAIAYQDSVYVIGGTYPDGYLSSVVYANRNAAGDFGYWGSAEEAAAATANRTKRKERALKQRPPFEGVVKEVLQTQAYTYVELESKNGGGSAWIAGPKIDNLKAGDRVGFNQGTTLQGFSSRELQRTFPAVTLVGTMQIQ